MPTRWVQVLIPPVRTHIRIHSRQYRYVQPAPLAVPLRSSRGNTVPRSVGNFFPRAAFVAVPSRCPSYTCDDSRLSTSSAPCPATPGSPRGSSDTRQPLVNLVPALNNYLAWDLRCNLLYCVSFYVYKFSIVIIIHKINR